VAIGGRLAGGCGSASGVKDGGTGGAILGVAGEVVSTFVVFSGIGGEGESWLGITASGLPSATGC
jgi:hypothetical protein